MGQMKVHWELAGDGITSLIRVVVTIDEDGIPDQAEARRFVARVLTKPLLDQDPEALATEFQEAALAMQLGLADGKEPT